MDFSHNEKLEEDTLRSIEQKVNQYIESDLIVEKKIMPKKEAERIGAEMEFGKSYGDLVTAVSYTHLLHLYILNQPTG